MEYIEARNGYIRDACCLIVATIATERVASIAAGDEQRRQSQYQGNANGAPQTLAAVAEAGVQTAVKRESHAHIDHLPSNLQCTALVVVTEDMCAAGACPAAMDFSPGLLYRPGFRR
jgi:hypothetical protein